MKMSSRVKQYSAPSPYHLLCFCCSLFFFFSFQISSAQNATTDPSEAKALNSIFQQWDAQAASLWNKSGELCTGSALDETRFGDGANNPAILCDCNYENGSICHITQLRVFALDKSGVIPEDIVALQYLTLLKIDQNFFTGTLPAFIGNLPKLQSLSIAINAFYGTIPKELGNLSELTSLSIGHNNFSGTLPPELVIWSN
ncbi:hypothetical protein I3843_Q044000 [Carya illinoinensis]|nr:hypothetical protein I3843_Q044000 [Carya illinoinensis]